MGPYSLGFSPEGASLELHFACEASWVRIARAEGCSSRARPDSMLVQERVAPCRVVLAGTWLSAGHICWFSLPAMAYLM